ncbi:hypothetical protein SBOR_5732 [Sclerotinia borealis F-4128]|uniref:Uncharacterized protein n=1 Tax=Sclerotinia borealis (strain F-4128) TaxID=1432307 RepID=W9CGL6_SCLBF|nr:hypothetical protein SBOR_5732 [Sclerotinia borealis F-4128]
MYPSQPNGALPNRSSQTEKQPHSKSDHDSRRGSHASNEGKAAVILLEGRQKDMVTQLILEEQEEGAEIKALEDKKGWKFTSTTAGKMFLRIQDKDTKTFIECNDFARDCEKAIRTDPRKKGAHVLSLATLLTPDKKAQHLKRLIALLSSKNKYAQYWTVGDLPDEWFKIDDAVLCSKEEQGVLLKEVDKKKKILEKSKSSKVEVDGKSKERRVLIDTIERKKKSHEKSKIGKVTVDEKSKDESRVLIDTLEKKMKVFKKLTGGKVEVDGNFKEEPRGLIDEVEKKKKIFEKSTSGKVEGDGKSKEEQQVLIDEVEEKRKIFEKSTSKVEVGGKSKDGNVQTKRVLEKWASSKVEIDEQSKKRRVLIDEVEKRKKVLVDGKSKIENVQAKKRHGIQ